MIRLSNSISRGLSAALLFALLPGACLLAEEPVRGPLPESQKDLIHQLARSHEKIQRQVTLTETGYEATTTSTDPVIAAALRAHVAYMQKRIAAGSMVRRWDPAYVEMIAHQKDLTLGVVELPNGLQVTMVGATPEAVAVAHNHARIVSGFVEEGPPAVRREHAPALEKPDGS